MVSVRDLNVIVKKNKGRNTHLDLKAKKTNIERQLKAINGGRRYDNRFTDQFSAGIHQRSNR